MNNFNLLCNKIEQLKKEIPYFNVGKTILNNNIICFVLGNKNSKNKIILHGGIHAREYITSFLLVKIIKYLKCFRFDACIYILPLVNPDGVFISCSGINKIKNYKIKKLFNSFTTNLKLIKCNARGVDLNTNFNALWGKGKLNRKNKPNLQNFVGFTSSSENEVKSLENLTLLLKPQITISYHSKGEVFYWGFDNSKKYNKNYLKLEKALCKTIFLTTNYKPIFTKNSCGGYKDWCIKNLKIPSFTIEVGSDKLKHPIKLKNLNGIFDKNKNLVLNLIKEYANFVRK